MVNSDLTNLLTSVFIPIVMVGNDLRLRRFTPMAEKIFNLIPSDVGRPIGDIKPNLNVVNLDSLITETIDTVSPREIDVQDTDGRWYSLRIRPYKSLEHRIDGAVLALLDIGLVRRDSGLLLEAVRYATLAAQLYDRPLLVLDGDHKVLTSNSGFERIFGLPATEILGRLIYDLDHGRWNLPELHELLERRLPEAGFVDGFDVSVAGEGKAQRLRARLVDGGPDGTRVVLLGFEGGGERRAGTQR